MSFAVLIFGFLLLAALVWRKVASRKSVPLPPGPPADPLIGHLRVIPSDGHDTFFYKLGKIYGDVVHLNVLGRSTIVLNSVQAAVDLLDKRSSNYSDRAYFPIFETMGYAKSLIFMKYGKDFQLHRRMYQQYFGKNEGLQYRPLQAQEAYILAHNLVSKPDDRENHLVRFSTALMMYVAYGHRIVSNDDPYLKIAEDVNHLATHSGPIGGTPVDMFPFLRHFPKWFPGAYYAGVARERQALVTRQHEFPYSEVKKKMEEGTATPSFLTKQLELMKQDGSESSERIEHIQAAAATIYSAGAETTSNTLSFFFLAMILNPECQARAQEEIDAVIGPGRLPEFNDRPSLPYLEHLSQETLRWMQAAPLGIPHKSIADDIYNGMLIPKGSVIIANTRGMTLDENVYSKPFDFDPTRYFPKPEGRGEPYPVGPFGFGRRICPGRYFAVDSLWIAIATILSTMSISKALDSDGKEITPGTAVESGITSHPLPFPCTIKPRNIGVVSLLSEIDRSY